MAAIADDRIAGISTSVAVKAPVHTVATSNISLSGLQTINGVALDGTNLYRVLCVAQTDTTQNGIYDATTGSWSRSNDFDGNRDVVKGTRVLVAQPSSSNAVEYELTSANPITIGSSSLTFSLRYSANVTYLQTAAEIAASVTPTSLFYPEGHVYRYGTNTSPGTTDMTTAFQTASKLVNPYAPPGQYLVNGQIDIIANQQWILDGCVINTTTSTLTIFSASVVDDWSLVGPFTIKGNGSTSGTAKGIYIKDCRRFRVVDPTVRSLKGYGIYLDSGSSTTARSDHGTVESPRLDSCYIGWQDIPGTGAEYVTVINAFATNCTVTGIATGAGNINWVGGQCVDNVGDGIELQSGSNHAHGIITGMQVNHNAGYGVHAVSVVNGQTFSGCHFYQNSIWFENCAGIQFDGGHIDCTVYNYKNGSSSLNFIRNMYCPGGYGFVRGVGSNNGHDQLIITDCFGPGIFATGGDALDLAGVNMNDVSLLHVYAVRDPTLTQSTPSGTPTDLVFTTKTFDHRGAYVLATGIATIPSTPVSQAGIYRVNAHLIFAGTAMSSTASIVSIYVNGAASRLSLPAINSTTSLAFVIDHEMYLGAGDAIKLVANISGTTPTFGHGTYQSYFSLEKIQ